MTDFLNQTEFENRKQNESNNVLDNQLMLLEFALFDKKVEKNMIQAGLGLKLFFGILLLIMETLGNYLLFCMVWYETFGMDSKKRTITNQLLSRMIFALIFFNIFFMPGQYFFILWIPVSEYFQKQIMMKAKLDHTISLISLPCVTVVPEPYVRVYRFNFKF